MVELGRTSRALDQGVYCIPPSPTPGKLDQGWGSLRSQSQSWACITNKRHKCYERRQHHQCMAMRRLRETPPGRSHGWWEAGPTSWALGDEGPSKGLGLQRAGWEVASHPLWGGRCQGAIGWAGPRHRERFAKRFGSFFQGNR